IVPAHSGAFSALGCLVSPLRYDAVQTYRAPLEDKELEAIEDRLVALEAQCLAPLAAEGHGRDAVRITRSLDLRYARQNYEIAVACEGRDPAALRHAFERRPRQLYGYATGERVECVNLRVAAFREDAWAPAPVSSASGAARAIGAQPAYFPET